MSLLTICLIFGCDKDSKKMQIKDKYKGESLCVIVESLIRDDLKYRVLMQPSFSAIIDSIKTSRKLKDELLETEIDSLAKDIFLKKVKKISKKKIDSLMKLQIKLDNRNTELLIDIIKNIGFPTKDNTECKRAPGFIFRHSQKQYWDEIKPLIKQELEKGNIPKSHYDLLMDHLNGRKKSNKLHTQ